MIESCMYVLETEALCLLRNVAFVQAPNRAEPAMAAGAAGVVLATVPQGADAFVFKGSKDSRGRVSGRAAF